MVLPQVITGYFPLLGLIMLLIALILEIVSAAQFKDLDPPAIGQKTSDTYSFAKYHDMAIVFSIIGLALFMYPRQ